MYVNAFWFGFLIAMVVILVLTIVLALIKARQDEEEWLENQPTEDVLGRADREEVQDGEEGPDNGVGNAGG